VNYNISEKIHCRAALANLLEKVLLEHNQSQKKVQIPNNNK